MRTQPTDQTSRNSFALLVEPSSKSVSTLSTIITMVISDALLVALGTMTTRI